MAGPETHRRAEQFPSFRPQCYASMGAVAGSDHPSTPLDTLEGRLFHDFHHTFHLGHHPQGPSPPSHQVRPSLGRLQFVHQLLHGLALLEAPIHLDQPRLGSQQATQHRLPFTPARLRWSRRLTR